MWEDHTSLPTTSNLCLLVLLRSYHYKIKMALLGLPAGTLSALAAIIGVTIGILYLYFRQQFKYWKNRSIPSTKPSFPFGNLNGVNRTRSMGEIVADIYSTNKGHKAVGYYAFCKPNLLVRDPETIKNILVKDFSSFHDRGIDVDVKIEPLANHLFLLSGQEWRNLRVKLTPTFTSGKMKMMFNTMISVADTLKKVLDEPAKKGTIINIKDYMARYTTDVIGSCAFGLDVNSLENPKSEFRVMSQAVLDPTIPQRLANLLVFIFPQIAKFLKMRLLPEHLTKFFYETVKDVITEREEKNIQRKDFMQLLIQLKNKGYIEDVDHNDDEAPLQEFTILKAAAQAFVFFFAGFETSSTTMQFALYELALNHAMQKRLQKEMDSVVSKNGGQLTYEGVMSMEYLDLIVSETLRKYPIAPFLMRQCNKDYPVPDSDITILKGDSIVVSIQGLHHDPEIYPDPQKFDPERFTTEEKEKRHHYAYIPFGEGPRICIGNRFALQQTKVGLACILTNFNVDVCEATPIPIKFDPKLDLLSVIGGMPLRLSHRK